MRKIFLVDGYSILFRTYYSTQDMKTSNDVPIGGVFGFARTVFSLIEKHGVENLVITLDSGTKTFRSEMYEEYKANRVETPQTLIPQFAILQEFLDCAEIASVKKHGFEADDIIASIVKKFADDEIVVVTSDKDLMQLVNNRVSCLDFFKEKTYKTPDVLEKFGVLPSQIVDYLSLLGDSSDNIPGVKGCGNKGAVKLIEEFGSLENIIQNRDKITNSRLKNAIENYKDDGILSKKLASLDENVTIPEINFEVSKINLQKTIEFLEKYEMNSILWMVKKLEKKLENKNIPKETKAIQFQLI